MNILNEFKFFRWTDMVKALESSSVQDMAPGCQPIAMIIDNVPDADAENEDELDICIRVDAPQFGGPAVLRTEICRDALPGLKAQLGDLKIKCFNGEFDTIMG